MPGPSTFHLDVRPDGDIVTMVLSGDVDLSVVDDVRSGLEEALGKNHGTLVVDMAAVTFIDSAGIAALMHARRAAHADGRRMRVERLSPATTRVFELTGITGILTGIDDG